MYTGTIIEFLNMGGGEIMLILAVVLLLFGGKKLPELARGLGKGIREFKDASDGVKREIHRNINSVGVVDDIKSMIDDTNNDRYHPSESALESQMYPDAENKNTINLEKESVNTEEDVIGQNVHNENTKVETDKTNLN